MSRRPAETDHRQGRVPCHVVRHGHFIPINIRNVDSCAAPENMQPEVNHLLHHRQTGRYVAGCLLRCTPHQGLNPALARSVLPHLNICHQPVTPFRVARQHLKLVKQGFCPLNFLCASDSGGGKCPIVTAVFLACAASPGSFTIKG